MAGIKFAHLADIHAGSYREPKLRELGTQAFTEAVNRCISKNVDFALISGDLFNTSLPPIECLKNVVTELKKLKDSSMPVYTIAGSHDFSPSGKTMLDVLEEAGLVINVCKGSVEDGKLKLEFTVDEKTGAKITGMIGKKGMLEKKYYEDLLRENLEAETGFKIFMFHTAITELKTEELEMMEAAPLSLLPRGFDYYAGGHVHIVKEASIDGYKNLVYPGPVFPNSFAELEKLGYGGFHVYDDGKLTHERIERRKVENVTIDCSHKTPQQITEEATGILAKKELKDKILLLRFEGKMESGKTSEVAFNRIIELAYEKGAYFTAKNTNKLSTKEFEEIKVTADTAEEAEKLAIAEHVGQVKSLKLDVKSEKELIEKLMTVLDVEKEEGEKQTDYEARVNEEMNKIFG